MTKTTKNKIAISGRSTVEDILVIIGSHLTDISGRFNITGFCDIGFYFNSYDGAQKFNLIDENKELQEWHYKTRNIKPLVSTNEELQSQRLSKNISYDEVEERIAALTKRIEADRLEKIRLMVIAEEREKAKAEERRKLLEKEKLLKEEINAIKTIYADELGLDSISHISVREIKTIKGAANNLPEELLENINFPLYVANYKGNKAVYNNLRKLIYRQTPPAA